MCDGDLAVIRAEIEGVADEIGRRLVRRLPQVSHVYLDPAQTPGAAEVRPDRRTTDRSA